MKKKAKRLQIKPTKAEDEAKAKNQLHTLPSKVVYIHPRGRFHIRVYLSAGGPIPETIMGVPR